MSPRKARSEVFGRSKGRSESVASRFEDFIAGVSEEIDDALGNTLSVISVPSAPVSDIGNEVGRRNVFRVEEARTGEGPDVLLGKGSVVEMEDVVTVVGEARVGGEWSVWSRREIFMRRWQ